LADCTARRARPRRGSGTGVISSIGLYETPEQADESTKVAASWVREEKLDSALPNAPKITSGEVVS
jgi:hypothetical protein